MTVLDTAGKLTLDNDEECVVGISSCELRNLAAAFLRLREAAKHLADVLGECNCSEAFTSRKLRDPQCLFCDNRDEIKDVREAADGF